MPKRAISWFLCLAMAAALFAGCMTPASAADSVGNLEVDFIVAQPGRATIYKTGSAVFTVKAGLPVLLADAVSIEDLARIIEYLINSASTMAVTDAAAAPVIDRDALIAALRERLGERFPEEAERVEALRDALDGAESLSDVVEAIQDTLGIDLDPTTIVEALRAAVQGELDLGETIRALIEENFDLDEILDALKNAFADELDLFETIKGLFAGGFDLEAILNALKERFSLEALLRQLLDRFPSLISFTWYARTSRGAVPVSTLQDENTYTGAETRTLTVTRKVAPADNEQYVYYCTARLNTALGIQLESKIFHTGDVVLTILVRDEPETPAGPVLDNTDHRAYIQGYPDGSFRPNAKITRAEAAVIFYRLLTEQSRARYAALSSGFSDVPFGSWYSRAVSTLAAAGVLKGYPDGTFRPDASITRAEMAAILTRFSVADQSGLPAGSGSAASFRDVPATHWAAGSITEASKNGWINGYADGTFRPDASITRAETVTMINRALFRNPESIQSFSGMVTFMDNQDTGAWYYTAVQEAANAHTFTRDASGVERWTALAA